MNHRRLPMGGSSYAPVALLANLWLNLVLFVPSLCAQSSTPLPLTPPLLLVTTADGLPSNQVSGVLQDAKGAFWLITPKGLVHYENYRITAHFNSANTTLVPDRRFTAAGRDGQNRLWFGTYKGLIRRDEGGFASIARADGLADNRITCLLADPSRGLWVGTWKGLSLVPEAGKIHTFAQDKGLPTTAVAALLLDKRHNLWVGYATDGLWRYDGEEWEAFGGGEGSLNVNALHEDRRGDLWIGTVDGLFYLSAENPQSTIRAPTVPPTLCLLEDSAGRLWAGSREGLYWHLDGSWHPAVLEPGLSPAIACLFEDRQQNLWIGTWGAGLWRLRSGVYTQIEEFADDKITTLAQDQRGDLWVGAEKKLYRLAEGNWRDMSTAHSLPPAELDAVIEDEQGLVWLTSKEDGLRSFDGAKIDHFSPDHYLPEGQIHTQIETPDGTLWFGTDAGLLAFDGHQFLPYGKEEGLPHPVVYSLENGASNDLWIGTGSGLARRQNGRITTVLSPADLPAPTVRALALAGDGTLWIATNRGLVRYWQDQCQVFSRADGLPNDHIRDLALDTQDRLWVATSGGLALLEPDAQTFESFTKADGLTSDLLYTLCSDSEGGIWAGSLSGGIVRYDGRRFYHLTHRQGLPSNTVRHVFQDGEGHIWLATDKGLARYHRGALPPTPNRSTLSPIWLLALALLVIAALAFKPLSKLVAR